MPKAQTTIPVELSAAPATPGDVFLIANDTVQPADFRQGLKGTGRLLHCDSSLRIKGGYPSTDGLYVGLAISPTGVLHVSCTASATVSTLNAAFEPVAAPLPPKRRYGNMIFDRNGRLFLGVHSSHGGPVEPAPEHDGKLAVLDPRTGETEFFDVDIDGGRSGMHYISTLALAPDGRTVFYASEAGRRVLRYDIEARRQLEDFLVLPEEARGTYGLSIDADGRVIMATGDGATLFSPDAQVIRRYQSEATGGWTRAAFCRDPRHFFFGNFIEGVLERRDVESGECLHRLDLGLKGSLTSAVELPS